MFSLSLSLGRLVSLLVVVVDVVGEDLLANLVGTEDRGLAVEDVDLVVVRAVEKGTRSVSGSRRGGRERERVKKKMKNEYSLVRAISPSSPGCKKIQKRSRAHTLHPR